MVETRRCHLLQLDNRLLCEIFKSVSVRDKQQNLQQTCTRFRAVLQQPSFRKTWGCITVKLKQSYVNPRVLTQLIIWLLDRKSGISMIKVLSEPEGSFQPCHPERAAREQTALHALAAAMAAEDVPLEYAGCKGRAITVSAPLSFADVDTEASAVLQQTIELLAISCSDLQPAHWNVLCSLQRVRVMAVSLQPAVQPVLPVPHVIPSVQLSNLRQLVFMECSVSLQPVLQHLSALSRLTSLYFRQCQTGLSALSAGMPPLNQLAYLTFSDCNLIVVPPLAQLPHLEELNLDGNPRLRDVHLELRGLTALTELSMRRTPVDKGTLHVVQGLPALKRFKVRGFMWLRVKLMFLLGRLKHWGQALRMKLVHTSS